MAQKAAKKSPSGAKLIVTQIGGKDGKGSKKLAALIGLGLGRIRATSELSDTPAIRGMINSVRHLVTVEEKKG